MLYRHLQLTDPEFVTFLKTQTIQTEVTYTGEALSYGFLMKDEEDYNFLVDFVQDNSNVLNTCNTLLINDLCNEGKEDDSHSVFLESGGAFWPTFAVLLTATASICCFGMIYECFRRRISSGEQSVVQESSIPSQKVPLVTCLDLQSGK